MQRLTFQKDSLYYRRYYCNLLFHDTTSQFVSQGWNLLFCDMYSNWQCTSYALLARPDIPLELMLHVIVKDDILFKSHLRICQDYSNFLKCILWCYWWSFTAQFCSPPLALIQPHWWRARSIHFFLGGGSDHTARGIMRVEPEEQVALGAMPRGHRQFAGVPF